MPRRDDRFPARPSRVPDARIGPGQPVCRAYDGEMLRARSRRIDEPSFEFAGQPVRLTSVETTLQLGRPPFVAAWTYRRPGHVSLGDTGPAHAIRDYGIITRAVLFVLALAAPFTTRRFR